MRDLISRRMAIDAINKLHDKPNAWLDYAVETVKELPSVQPDLSEYSDRLWKSAYERGKAEAQDTKWVSCSERLPEKNCRCLTTNEAWGSFEVDWNAWIDGQWLYPNEKPIAWMSFPEPYRGGNE